MGKPDRAPELAAELVRLKVDMIVVAGGPTVRQRTGILFFYPFTVGTTSEKKTASQKNFTQNLAGHQMPWHVDNKQTLPDSTEKMLDYKGLITLIYLDDIDHGPFQFVRGSNLWTSAFYKEMWDDVIEKYSKDIVSFNNQKAGTAIFYDTRGIHRAEPFQKGSPRTALFAQYADFDKPTGEPIFINTEHMAGLSERSIQVLRFGRKASARTWPIPADKIQSAQTETRRSSYLSMIKSVIGI